MSQQFHHSGVPKDVIRPAATLLGTMSPARGLNSILLVVALVTGAITHGYHLFLYPLYVTDEGVYMQRAWAVIREGALSPYTFSYDHAPAGWLVIAAWVSLLPHHFQTFGDAINAGRMLMLLIHLVSVYLLFLVTRRLSGSTLGAFAATFLFNVSPLAIFYQRQVVLDNLMVFWVLLSLYLATSDDRRILTPMLSGTAFGIAVLTKENAIFFIPGLAYLLFAQMHLRFNRRFGWGLAAFASVAIIWEYFQYAALKHELLPDHLDFSLSAPPARHVALLYTIWQQLHRNQGSILNIHSLVWQSSLGAWLPKDAFLLVVGTFSTLVNLAVGLRDRQRRQGQLIAALLAAGYLLYLVRGSVVLEFYVVPLIPFLAMNIGLLAARLLPILSSHAVVQIAALAILLTALLIPIGHSGGYVFVRDQFGKVVPHDLYKLDLTGLQAQQLAFIRQHIPPDARIIMDEEFWVDLHDIRPSYRYAHSHFLATGDPAVRDRLFARDPTNVDYIVMSNKMLVTMQDLNTTHQYDWIFDALNHAQRIWMLQLGGIELEIWQVQH
jgi:4-amino-4-deoxy-L-arabinose transferase-like glycosyltransferase